MKEQTNENFYFSHESPHFQKMRWYGLKKYVKMIIGFKLINIIISTVLQFFISKKKLRRFPINKPEATVKIKNSCFIMLDTMKCSTAKELYWCDGMLFDQDEQKALDFFCDFSQDADCVMDIGANTGLFSLAVATVNKNVRINAFEIVPDVYLLLLKNIIRNNFIGRITAHLTGVGLNGRNIIMPSNCHDSALPTSFSSKSDFKNGVNVPTVSLNGLIHSLNKSDTVLIKIDVEATEWDIFQEGEEFIRTFLPEFVCEILPWSKEYMKIDNMLKSFGYDFYLISENGLEKQDALFPDKTKPNWCFTKNNRHIDPFLMR